MIIIDQANRSMLYLYFLHKCSFELRKDEEAMDNICFTALKLKSNIEKPNSHDELCPNTLFLVNRKPLQNVMREISSKCLNCSGIVSSRNH